MVCMIWKPLAYDGDGGQSLCLVIRVLQRHVLRDAVIATASAELGLRVQVRDASQAAPADVC